MEHNALLDPFVRMLEQISRPEQVRAVEANGGIDQLWQAIVDSGYLDALVPEQQGGFGLTLRDIGPLIETLGSYLVPAPVAQTMAARAIIAHGGEAYPEGPILLGSAVDGKVHGAPMAMAASHMLVDTGTKLDLMAIDADMMSAQHVAGKLAADIALSAPMLSLARPTDGLRPLSAALWAAHMAGAASRVLAMTTAYADERVQFGKPIGKQQAVQQQLAVLAEKTVLARMAAGIGYSCDLIPCPSAAAVAKTVSSAAIVEVSSIAHAVHGAIGISEEYDLQLYTRRMHQWRLADGSEGWWSRQLGSARLASDGTSMDFIRQIYSQNTLQQQAAI